jgi:hypothetical protein
MATLLELHDLFDNSDLIKKVGSALLIEVKNILDGTPDANDRAYAAKVFTSPHTEAHRALKYVLAANNDQTVANITGASDTQIKINVAAAVPILADADAGA